jgi:hypothetical protein
LELAIAEKHRILFKNLEQPRDAILDNLGGGISTKVNVFRWNNATLAQTGAVTGC